MKNALKNSLKAGLVASIATGVVVVTQPQSAEAAILVGSQIDFVGRADAEAIGIDIQELLPGVPESDQVVYALSATGSFASIIDSSNILANIISRIGFAQDAPVPSAAIPNWLTFGTFSGDASNDVVFTLQSISSTLITNNFGQKVIYDFSGIFQDGTPGIGSITSQTLAAGASSFSGTITAVPTPALLPGLAAMGASLLRKRKKAEVAA
jgi:hypothetical protein